MNNHFILNFIKSANFKGDVDYSIENGKVVVKKMKGEDQNEELFFNKEYLRKNGFPDAEISIGKISPDGIMRGGYYKHPEKLTYPFREFVFLIQGRRQQYEENNTPLVENDVVVNEPQDNNKQDNTTGFFQRLGNYGNQISSGVNSGISNLGSYFGSKQKVSDKQEFDKDKPIESEEEQFSPMVNKEQNS